MTSGEDWVGELAASVGESRLVTDPDAMAARSRDEANLVAPGRPAAVLLAADASEVQAALEWAARHGVPVVPRGAGSGLVGGAAAVEGCLVVSLERMDAIRELSPADQLAVVEPGVVTARLDQAAREHGLMYAPDPSSHEISTIGGNIATNAGGLRCVKYGVTRESVLGLDVVLAGGRLLSTGRRTVKDVAGYDLTSLFVGSEGTLGVVVGATVKLRPLPAEPPVTVVGSFPQLGLAGEAASEVVLRRLSPSLLELMDAATLQAIEDWKHTGLGAAEAVLVAQADGPRARESAVAIGEAFEACGADIVVVSADEVEAAQLLEVRRLAYPAVERLGRCLVEDVGVPRSRLGEMLSHVEAVAARHGVRISTVAHAGDGNLHPTFILENGTPEESTRVWQAAGEIFARALELGGTLTGEHGVGALKRRWLSDQVGEESLRLQQEIKRVFDPLGIMNPGKAL